MVHCLPCRTGGIFTALPFDQGEEVLHPTYMDDTVLPVFEPDAALLIEKVVVVASLAVSVCAHHGLAVNFVAGKSEVLLSVHGLRAKACSELLVSLLSSLTRRRLAARCR